MYNSTVDRMMHSIKDLAVLVPLALVLCVPLCAQDGYTIGEVCTDTTIEFSVNPSVPVFKIHFVAVRCDTLGASYLSHVQISRKADQKVVQEWSDSLSFPDPYGGFADAPTFVDFNFDGYQDICFECFWSSLRPPSYLGFFREYNRKTGLFEPAHQFDGLDGNITILDDKSIQVHAEMGGGEWIESNYKYRGSKLVLIERRERRWEGNEFKLIIQRPVKGLLKTVSVYRD